MEHYAPLALGPAFPTQYDFQHVITWGQAYNSGASAPVETVPARMSLGELQDIELHRLHERNVIHAEIMTKRRVVEGMGLLKSD